MGTHEIRYIEVPMVMHIQSQPLNLVAYGNASLGILSNGLLRDKSRKQVQEPTTPIHANVVFQRCNSREKS